MTHDMMAEHIAAYGDEHDIDRPLCGIPDGATVDDDPDGLADELTAAYVDAVRAVEDRAQLARYGGRDILTYYAWLRPCNHIPLTDLGSLAAETRERDAYHADQYRQAVAQRDTVRQHHADRSPA